jgi:hypothetical protein
MRGPKPGEEIDRTIGQDGIRGNSRYPNGVGKNGVHSWIGQSSWFPGFLIVKKFSVRADIPGPSLPVGEHRLPVYPHQLAKNQL